MNKKELTILVTSRIGWCLNFFYKFKHKFVIINKLIYGQVIKYSSCQYPHMLLAVRPITLIGANKIKFGEKVQIGQYSTISAWSEQSGASEAIIIIHDNVTIGAFAHITAINKITIENGVLIGKFVTITDNSHGKILECEMDTLPIERTLFSKGSVKICKNVWLGDKVTILPGVCVGEGSIIGANSVVTRDIPPFSVACGIPAKVIKKLK